MESVPPASAGGTNHASLPHPLTRVVLTSTQSAPLPTDAIFRVFQHNAALCEFVANFVAPLKVAAVARFLALVDQFLNLLVQHLALWLAENIQHAVDALDRGHDLAFVVFAQCSSGQ